MRNTEIYFTMIFSFGTRYASLVKRSDFYSRCFLPLYYPSLVNLLVLDKCHLIVNDRKNISTTSNRRKKKYYEILDIEPTATQAQIKSAYYKMSKQYHPDVSSKPETQQRFTEISQAYEVLGDLKKRRMYDMGLGISVTNAYEQGFSNSSDDSVEDDPYKPSSRAREANKFDEFCKSHYSELRSRSQRDHHKRRERQHSSYSYTNKNNESRNSNLINFFIVSSFFLIVSFITIKHGKL